MEILLPTLQNPKHEIRNPKQIQMSKSEIRNPKQIQMSKSEIQNTCRPVSIIWIFDFGFVSNFVFRISDFENQVISSIRTYSSRKRMPTRYSAARIAVSSH